MKISRSTQYGLIAASYIAQNYKSGLVMAARISKAHKLPLEYLLKILQQLVKAKVLTSKRGPGGGFSLARPANKISLLELIEAVEGPVGGTLYLAEQTGNEAFSLKIEAVCREASEKARSVYARAKLSEVIAG